MIKNIIFDLGGVLIGINYQLTIDAFKRIGFEGFDNMYTQFKANPFFASLERGVISREEFYTGLQAMHPASVTPQQIDDAWNELLLDFRTDTLPFLTELKQHYRIFLLSNINCIHYDRFRDVFTKATGEESIDPYFHKAYYSHFIHERKPDEAAYRFVLNDAGIKAEETLFIDDSHHNVSGAAATGLHTILLPPGERVQDAVQKFLKDFNGTQ